MIRRKRFAGLKRVGLADTRDGEITWVSDTPLPDSVVGIDNTVTESTLSNKYGGQFIQSSIRFSGNEDFNTLYMHSRMRRKKHVVFDFTDHVVITSKPVNIIVHQHHNTDSRDGLQEWTLKFESYAKGSSIWTNNYPLLNTYLSNGCVIAISLRTLKPEMIGKNLITIEANNVEKTFKAGFNSLNLSEIRDFCNGSVGYVTWIADQSGKENHFTYGRGEKPIIYTGNAFVTLNHKVGVKSLNESMMISNFTGLGDKTIVSVIDVAFSNFQNARRQNAARIFSSFKGTGDLDHGVLFDFLSDEPRVYRKPVRIRYVDGTNFYEANIVEIQDFDNITQTQKTFAAIRDGRWRNIYYDGEEYKKQVSSSNKVNIRNYSFFEDPLTGTVTNENTNIFQELMVWGESKQNDIFTITKNVENYYNYKNFNEYYSLFLSDYRNNNGKGVNKNVLRGALNDALNSSEGESLLFHFSKSFGYDETDNKVKTAFSCDGGRNHLRQPNVNTRPILVDKGFSFKDGFFTTLPYRTIFDQFTATGWVKKNEAGEFFWITKLDSYSNLNSFAIYFYNDRMRYAEGNPDNGSQSGYRIINANNIVLSMGEWCMVSLTKRKNVIKFYFNGQLLHTSTNAYNYVFTSNEPVLVGGVNGNPFSFDFDGNDTRFYIKDIGEEKILNIFNKEKEYYDI